MQKIRRFAAFLLAVAALVVGVGLATAQSSPAGASAPPVYSTSYRTETIYAGRCIHTHTRTVRYFSWSTKAGHYVLLSRPSVTISDSYKCHS